ncbi:methyl-accepting chemotaxis protein [Ktedonosporobacter rubrisoli]|uniref:Methyl-accepting chemotaxis protein n=1 Tax=Ktedonosporobacter rubrisoli TaxID=2509675 RepID=A0A4P6K295_KTERU|nr:cache domain-containing protein [Ktedonosporobacter rubrisoli]QBD82327.1 methyl-accepting chemotaxis protein [Ktedonosporobacter rubrisoli]
MSQRMFEPRRRTPLSLRVSLGLLFAAVLPLIITIIFLQWQARPALVSQANAAMENDAKTRVQLIDAYFGERLLDLQTLAQVPSVQEFLAAPPIPNSPDYQNLALHASFALEAGIYRDHRYTSWELFNPKGQLRLYYPLNTKPLKHGSALIPDDELNLALARKTFISAVYVDPTSHKAAVDIYSPIVQTPQPGTSQQPAFLGFIRTSLNLDYIWNIVQGDLGNNGPGSYAFILDKSGICIANTDPARRFQAIKDLPADLQQRIVQEKRFGSARPVTVNKNPLLAQKLDTNVPLSTFQMPLSGQEAFQVALQTSATLPWYYFVLSPINTVTSVANQQLIENILIALVMALLVALAGWAFGQNITRPILTAVEYIRSNSQTLSSLATKQQDIATEQMWVVDASQIGLQSVQYYNEATKIATHQLRETVTALLTHWNQLDAETARQALERIIAATQYIDQASRYQEASNNKLSTALNVATQVNEQLATGATSAANAATQLEQVVAQLRSVVGK